MRLDLIEVQIGSWTPPTRDPQQTPKNEGSVMALGLHLSCLAQTPRSGSSAANKG